MFIYSNTASLSSPANVSQISMIVQIGDLFLPGVPVTICAAIMQLCKLFSLLLEGRGVP